MLVVKLLFTGMVAYAQQTDIPVQQSDVPKIYMVFIDYDAFHIQLIDRCIDRFPETAQPLRTAIAQWGKKNRVAMQKIRSLMRDKIVRDGMPEKDADERAAQAGKDVTRFMTKGLEAMPESHLRSNCFGGYAETLASPSMDYVAFLELLKAALNR
jgi:hypothetical protein